MMLPLAHIIARRRLDEKRKNQVLDMSPHDVRPLVGLRRRATGAPIAEKASHVGELLVPTATYVDIFIDKTDTVYKILMSYEEEQLQKRVRPAAPNSTSATASSAGIKAENSSGATTNKASLSRSSSSPPVQDALDLYFPVSECGKLSAVKVLFNQRTLQGEMVRQSRKDGRFIPSSSREEFLREHSEDDEDDDSATDERGSSAEAKASTGAGAGGQTAAAATSAVEGDAKKPPTKKKRHISVGVPKKKQPQMFYYRVPFVLQQLADGGTAPKPHAASSMPSKLDIYVEVKVKTIVSVPLVRYRILFPLMCLPQSPSSLRCEMAMPHFVRRVWTTNAKHRINAFLNNFKADFSLIFSLNNPLHLEEYLFDVEIELGEPIIPECIDPVSLLVLATTAALMVLYFLSKDLQDDF